MEKFTTVTAKAAPLDMPNVDTDQIIPKNFLKRVERTGFGQFLCEELAALLETHGFVCERFEDTLGGMGFIVVAKKPLSSAPPSSFPKPTDLQGA